jgi:hypothetical protein
LVKGSGKTSLTLPRFLVSKGDIEAEPLLVQHPFRRDPRAAISKEGFRYAILLRSGAIIEISGKK